MGNHFDKVVMASETAEYVISVEDKSFTQSGNFMQPEALEMFSFDMIKGKRNVLEDVNSIVLSESLAKTLFGNQNPMGQTVRLGSRILFKVNGIFKDLPFNSTFRETSFVVSLDVLFNAGVDPNAWTNYNMFIYAQLLPKANIQKVNTLIKDELYNHIDQERAKEDEPELFLHPMCKWHLYSKFENGVSTANERLQFVWFNGIIGIFVLVLACINFMNLSTARSEKRAKEVGIRKTIGSRRHHLIYQFFGESLLVTIMSLVFALVLVQITLPWFNNLADKNLSIQWFNPLFWLLCLVFTLFTGVLAGVYPAFYLSSFNPVKTLKGTFQVKRSAVRPRKVLVVFQFTISIALIIGTMIVYQQIQYAKNRPLGYDQQGLISFRNMYNKYDILSRELKKTGVALAYAEASYPLTNTSGSNNGFKWPGKSPNFDPSFNTIKVSYEYGKTVGWEIVEGRDFSRDFKTDVSGVILSQSAVKMMGLENPVGQSISSDFDYFGGGKSIKNYWCGE